jgi:hypothetical protein
MTTINKSLCLILLSLIPFCIGNLSRGGWDNRFLRYNEKFTYFVGMDLQQLASDSAIDFKNTLYILSKYGTNKIRIWLIANFLSEWEPNLYPYKRKNGLFDLYHWDEAYWSRLNAILKYAESKDIIIEISIFEVSGPMKYFGERDDQPYPYHNKFNLQKFGKPNSHKTFVPEFFDLNYTENGIKLQDLQKALIDKVLKETADSPNVYYEVMNEFPGVVDMVRNPEVHRWAKEMARYINSKTDKLVAVHSHGFGYKRTGAELEASSSYYWDKDYVDALNFHLYIYDPHEISQMLHGHQKKQKMLICNEGAAYYDICRSKGYPNHEIQYNKAKLYQEIRTMWGYITAGGYYSFYHANVPLINNPVVLDAAKAGQAARKIVETLPFWRMRPVRADGSEYDDIVLSGPAPKWQVTANEGKSYLIYFWGRQSSDPKTLSMRLPAAQYAYAWYDTRRWRPPIKSGKTSQSISLPPSRRWDPDSGVVLTVTRIR